MRASPNPNPNPIPHPSPNLYEGDGIEHAAEAQLVGHALAVQLARLQLGVGLDAAHLIRVRGKG